MKTIVWLLIICGIASVVKASPGTMARRRCGPVLEDYLRRLCKEFAEPDMRKKKSDELVGSRYQDNENGVTVNHLYDLYLKIVKARPQFRHGRVRRQSFEEPRGIVEECCLEPCSMDTLLSYCSS